MILGHESPVNLVSATLADFFPSGAVARTGIKRWYRNPEFGWQQLVLVQNVGASLADGVCCKLVTTAQAATRSAVWKVLITSAATSPVYCVNNTGAAVPDGSYFWALQKGMGYGLGAGAVATTGVAVSVDSAGTLVVASTGNTVVGIAMSALTASTTNTVDFNLPAGLT